MRVLIVKLGSIGDLVHALPAVAAIRRALPDAEISWVVEKRVAEILRGSPVIDELIEIETRTMRRVFSVRSKKYDVAIDMQGLIKSALIARLSGARRRWGFSRAAAREPAGRHLLTDTVETPPHIHVIHKNLHLAAEALGLEYDDSALEFPIAVDEAHRAEAAAIIDRAGSPYAILNPGGGWVTKLWHAEKFGALADRLSDELGLVPIVMAAPGEAGLAAKAAAASCSGRLIVEHASLKGFYELAKDASIYVGGDTGPTHIAVAAGAPVVGLFGPTEWWRNGSLNPDDIEVGRTDIDCRIDCHRRTCGKWICMDTGIDTVFEAVKLRLEKT